MSVDPDAIRHAVEKLARAIRQHIGLHGAEVRSATFPVLVRDLRGCGAADHLDLLMGMCDTYAVLLQPAAEDDWSPDGFLRRTPIAQAVADALRELKGLLDAAGSTAEPVRRRFRELLDTQLYFWRWAGTQKAKRDPRQHPDWERMEKGRIPLDPELLIEWVPIQSLFFLLDPEFLVDLRNAADSLQASPPPLPVQQTAKGNRGVKKRMTKEEAEQAMLQAIDADPDRLKWTAREWEQHIGCSLSTIHATEIWKQGEKARELARQERKDRAAANRHRPCGGGRRRPRHYSTD